jgi:hypothetical protein
MKIIGIFKGDCPTGWTKFDDWDGYFIRGRDASYLGTTAGTTTHNHSVDLASCVTSGGSHYSGVDRQEQVVKWLGGSILTHTHTVNPASFTMGSASTFPSYITVVFCSKEDS